MEDLLQLVSQAVKQNIDWSGIEATLLSFTIPMSRTKQNPAFHAEGDVWIHTKMVCENLMKLDSVQALSEVQQQAVFLAALLHDIGKIPTTRWEDDKWTSPNHTLVGSKMARQYLWQELDSAEHRKSSSFGKRSAILSVITASLPMPSTIPMASENCWRLLPMDRTVPCLP